MRSTMYNKNITMFVSLHFYAGSPPIGGNRNFKQWTKHKDQLEEVRKQQLTLLWLQYGSKWKDTNKRVMGSVVS